MLADDFRYTGQCREILETADARVGDKIRLIIKRGNSQEVVEGLLMPRFATRDDEDCVVVKLKTGYNVGVRIDSGTKIEIIGKGTEPHFSRPELPRRQQGLPKVCIMSTGGTIASRVDYRTGAVKPALDADDLHSVVPELAQIANVDASIISNIFSENIGPPFWSKIAESIEKEIRKGTDGIVVAHGTDTLAYTSSALSFALNKPPIPIVLVGAQRSSDRPSSDAATNLLASSAIAGQAPFAGVVIAMHNWISDETIAVHRGTKVRKCHTSRRDAFRSVNTSPLAYYDLIHRTLKMNTDDYDRRRKTNDWSIKPKFDPNVLLVKFHPGLSAGIIDWATATGYKGIILEGSGLGHISESLFSSLERAIKSGLVVAMCSQCIWGRVQLNVYSTGRDLLRMGVIPLYDMLSETALVKMMWAFGNEREPENVKQIMRTNLAQEFSERRVIEEKHDG
ncbi:MAG TPA: Glu-tRNA(Gln) amidotransferase subunit GatD [Candidatus Acidoferrum sp.]|nr:Glu-tRNA(Gln) amidotransferase subunit GatD [Candidatus Acidoferrum sp.]